MANPFSISSYMSELLEHEQELLCGSTNAQLGDDEQRRLEGLKGELDRCWELLRDRPRRRASRAADHHATSSSSDPIEGHLGI